jgi:hypothetical protein
MSDDDYSSDTEREEGFSLLLGGLNAQDMKDTVWKEDIISSENVALPDRKETAPVTAKPVSAVLRPESYEDVPESDAVFAFAYASSNGGRQISRPPVKIVELQNRGRGLLASRCIPKGSVIFTEQSAVVSQMSKKVRACQNCFRSLEPCSKLPCQSLPLTHLWPVPEIQELSQDGNLDVDKFGRICCRSCRSWTCSKACWNKLTEELGGCCKITAMVDKLSSLLPEFQPSVVLAIHMSAACLQRHRRTIKNDWWLNGMCGDSQDMNALELGLAETDDHGNTNYTLKPVYDAIVSDWELSECETRELSLDYFQKLACTAARNGVCLATQSPFQVYYSALVRSAGRGSKQHEQVKGQVALLGSSGQLERGMDRAINALVAPEINAIFPLTARINHSCLPNAQIASQEFVDSHMDLLALRDIEPGEEISISYIATGKGLGQMSTNRRQRELQVKYLFMCNCNKCAI